MPWRSGRRSTASVHPQTSFPNTRTKPNLVQFNSCHALNSVQRDGMSNNLKLTIEIKEEGGTWAWFVMRGEETVGGGYGQTEADARNDAESFKAEQEPK